MFTANGVPDGTERAESAMGFGESSNCIAIPPVAYYNHSMRTLTVRLPEALAANIEAESRERRISKSDVVRERLESAINGQASPTASLAAIAELIGCVDGLPADLSSRKKRHLKTTGYGQKRTR